MSETSGLAELVMDERRKGKSYSEIEQKHGVPALEARQMVREVIENTSIDDEWEMRGIAMLRLEKVIEYMWTGVENGSFKHAETIIKSIETVSNLLALNKQVMQEQKSSITDEHAAMIYDVVRENNRQIYSFITEQLRPNKRQTAALESWPQVVADASTQAIEATLYKEEEETE